MNFKTKSIIVALIVTLLAGFWVIKNLKKSEVASGDIYYCAMHPQIQSNHPGTCPICSMKLIKKEKDQVLPAADVTPKKSQDICLIHNCHKLHEGTPCPMMVIAKEGEVIKCPICGTFIGGKAGMKKILYWTDPMIPGFKSDKPGKSPMGMDMVPVFEEEGVEASLKSNSISGYAPILLTPRKQQLIGVKTAKVEKKRLYKIIQTVGTVEHEPGWVYVQIYQYDRPLIKRGQDVEVHVPGLEGEKFKGKVRSIETFADATTHTRTVKVRIQDPRGVLKLGMYADVFITVDLGESLVVPQEAIFNTGTRHIVFVDKGNGLFEPRDCEIGVQAQKEYQIKSGLNEGEGIVVSGNFLVDSESRLKAALEGMSNAQ